MTKEKPVLQVTFGLLHEQFKWFLGYIFFSSVATLIVTTIISYFTDDFIVQATDFDLHYIFMLIVGILCAYAFLPFFVSHGITRRNYFIGAALAALILATGAVLVISLLEVFNQWSLSGFSSIGGFWK